MRTWLLAFLIALVTLQSNGAAARGFCLPAPEAATAHRGPHVHPHHDTDNAAQSGTALPCVPGDADCEACHTHCAAALPGLAAPLGRLGPPPPCALEARVPASAPPQTPDRPQWPSMA